MHDALAAAVRADDPRLRWGATFACAGVPGYSCPDLTALVTDPDPQVRFAVACVLLADRRQGTARDVPRASLPALVLAFGPDPVAVVAGEAHDVVATVFQALPSLGLSLEADDKLVRGSLAAPALRIPTLGHLLETREIRPYLTEIVACLADPSARWHAACLLKHDPGADPARVVPALVAALLAIPPGADRDRAREDRQPAGCHHSTETGCFLDSLSRAMYPHPDPVAAVRPLLDHPDAEVAMAFAEAICEVRWAHRRVVSDLLLPWLIEALARGPEVRARALAALQGIAVLPPDALARLSAMAEDETLPADVRRAVREELLARSPR